MTNATSTSPAPLRRPSRRLRLVPAVPPPARCSECRAILDDWQIELARIERREVECPGCGAVLV